ncbi:MAG: DNA-processing protein DprA [Janthinobacterium lividum]
MTAPQNSATRARYNPPQFADQMLLEHLIHESGRDLGSEKQLNLLRGSGKATHVYIVGNYRLLDRPTVSIVGTREVSPAGRIRASRLARELASTDVVVMSGLAKGVDTAALTAAIQANGHVAAVIGTPLEQAYPKENANLQEEIYNNHVLISPFANGEAVYKGNFPKRNRVMAALSDATVIVEASDTSGTLHQAAECQRLGRWLFIMKSVVDDNSLNWPAKFIGKPKTAVLTRTLDLIEAIQHG